MKDKRQAIETATHSIALDWSDQSKNKESQNGRTEYKRNCGEERPYCLPTGLTNLSGDNFINLNGENAAVCVVLVSSPKSTLNRIQLACSAIIAGLRDSLWSWKNRFH